MVYDTPAIPNPWDIYMPLFLGEEWTSLGPLVEKYGDSFHPEALAEIAPGRDVTLSSYIRALNQLTQFRRTMLEFFERYDVLLLPTTAVPAFRAGHAPDVIGGRQVAPHWTTFMPLQVTWNMTDQPVGTVVSGFSKSGLPIGLMIVARIGREDLVLAGARVIEQAFPWAGRKPSFAPVLADRVNDEAVWT